MSGIEYDPGYVRAAYRKLVSEYPDESVYPSKDFRVEWGPIFHRGRLDGSARVLVIGQDPAAHETVCRRILVGEAGQRVQGLLAKMGITRSYVMVNAFLYSVYGQGGGERHVDDPALVAYRNRWFDAIAEGGELQAVVSLGHLADSAYQIWQATPKGSMCTATYATVLHPTYPESASRRGQITKAEAFTRLLSSWNDALRLLHPRVTQDVIVPLELYGPSLVDSDLAEIPSADLPAGIPPWMRSLDSWARRTGDDAQSKRATITVSVPKKARTWPSPSR